MVSRSPATGVWLGEVGILGQAEVSAAVQAARAAQPSWAELDIHSRCRTLLRFRDVIVQSADEIVDLLCRECGKPRMEALVHEVMASTDLITHLCKKAPQWLASEQIPLHMLKHRAGYRYYAPMGVVAVISPWNYPFVIPMGDVVAGLLAGNAVVLKPSEITPLVGLKIKELYDRAGLMPDLFQVVSGDAHTGAALIESGVNKVVFTGSVAGGKKVAVACAERLIPCTLELGGKAAAIVCDDADVEQASQAIVFGGFANSGQICMSVERVYAHASVYEPVLQRVVALTQSLRQGDPASGEVDVGAIIFPRQLEVAETLIQDAVAQGARVCTGGQRLPGQGMFFEPTVLADCTQDMRVMREEIFGPIVPVMRVQSDEDALAMTNDSELGLINYVFSKNRTKAKHLAERVQSGVVMINSVLEAHACPEVPFGGVKQSGYGRVHGKEGLRSMCELRHINYDRIPLKRLPYAFPYSERVYRWARRLLKWWF